MTKCFQSCEDSREASTCGEMARLRLSTSRESLARCMSSVSRPRGVVESCGGGGGVVKEGGREGRGGREGGREVREGGEGGSIDLHMYVN